MKRPAKPRTANDLGADDCQSSTLPDRRTFLKSVVAASLAGAPELVRGDEAARSGRQTAEQTEPFVGVQLGSHSLFDEEIENCLDLLQDSAEVNAVFMYATIYQGYSKERKIEHIAPDHGVAQSTRRVATFH